MPSAIVSVIIASAQSVGKVYVIGAVGFCAVLYPKRAPLLPAKHVAAVARFGFHALVLSLIYGTIARSVAMDTIGNYWFLIVAALVVVSISYVTATVLGYVFGIQKHPIDFDALRVSASFPNIVALPILIFPALCEYPVVYEAFGTVTGDESSEEQFQECVAQSTTMIFCYFFAWSFLFWSLGHQKLMESANRRVKEAEAARAESEALGDLATNATTSIDEPTVLKSLLAAFKQTFRSPGFVAMILGFITACIPPLQRALFSQGGALRFIGAAVETLGVASSPMSTMVVAASLVPSKIVHLQQQDEEEQTEGDTEHGVADQTAGPSPEFESSPIMSDPTFGPQQRRRPTVHNMALVIRRRSSMLMDRIQRSDRDIVRLQVWFILSRLIVSPALISSLLVGLDCGGALSNVPDLAKLVVVINSALPGALVVVVLLKSNPILAETARVVAGVYLPSYLLSIFSIAAWSSVGLYISIPGEDGLSFCGK